MSEKQNTATNAQGSIIPTMITVETSERYLGISTWAFLHLVHLYKIRPLTIGKHKYFQTTFIKKCLSHMFAECQEAYEKAENTTWNMFWIKYDEIYTESKKGKEGTIRRALAEATRNYLGNSFAQFSTSMNLGDSQSDMINEKHVIVARTMRVLKELSLLTEIGEKHYGTLIEHARSAMEVDAEKSNTETDNAKPKREEELTDD